MRLQDNIIQLDPFLCHVPNSISQTTQRNLALHADISGKKLITYWYLMSYCGLICMAKRDFKIERYILCPQATTKFNQIQLFLIPVFSSVFRSLRGDCHNKSGKNTKQMVLTTCNTAEQIRGPKLNFNTLLNW